MRTTLYRLLYLLLLIFVVSCQKESYFGVGHQAGLLLQDISGNCFPITVHGNYYKGSSITEEEFIEIQVIATDTGAYDIRTNTQNGMSFKGQGKIANTGEQTIRLYAVGIPVETGSYTYETYYNKKGCEVEVTVTDAPTPSVYTIADTSGNCPDIEVNGVYMQELPLDATDYVAFDVYVKKTGAYSILTETVNGISFAGSGSFTDTGVQHITLYGSGTPTAAGNINLGFKNNAGACKVPVTIKPISNDPGEYSINCASTKVNGSYIISQPTGATNTVSLFITVSKTGTYNISTGSVNGVSFAASGRFTAVSSNPVQVNLVASGTPAARGNFDYTVNANGNTTCSFTVPVTGPAEFTLDGAPGACALATVAGDFSKGSPLTGSNTVTVRANVTATGAYTIATTVVDGISFSATGTFTTTGVQDVVLKGAGTPTQAGSFSFTPQGVGVSGCSFDVSVIQPQVEPGIYTCKIDGVYTEFNNRAKASIENLLTPNTLLLDGFTGAPNGAEVPEFQIFINYNNGQVVGVGSYNVDGYLTPGYHIEIDYEEVLNDNSVIRWNTSSSLLSANPPFTINITSIDNNRVKGTFSGQITNVFQGSNKIRKITEGTFDLPMQ